MWQLECAVMLVPEGHLCHLVCYIVCASVAINATPDLPSKWRQLLTIDVTGTAAALGRKGM
jgi:hypothetical protein